MAKKGKCRAEGHPHVTTIISDVLSKAGIEYWYGKLGTAEANRVKNAMGVYGTRAHRIIATAIFNPLGKLGIGEFEEFQQRIKFLNEEIQKRNLTPVEAEKHVVCDELGYQGTLDGLFTDSNDGISIWDLKTGTKRPFDVLLQISAYAYTIDPTFGHITAFVPYINRLDNEPVSVLSFTGEELAKGFELFKHVLAIYYGKRQIQFSTRKRRRKNG